MVEFWQALVSLLIAATVVMGSPGPSTLSATAVGASFGFRPAVPYLAGLVLGTVAVLLVVIAGVLSLLVAVPGATPVLTVVSAGYILYLAYRIGTAPPLSRQDPTTAVPSFGSGLVLAIANPKAYLAISAVVGGTILSAMPVIDALLKTALLSGMIVLIHVLWLLAGASLARFLYDPVASRVANILLAVALAASAVLAFA
jgi:threonine/homoserine/homoserine lactone efflux protein